MQTLQRSRYDAPVRWFTSINHSLPQMSKFSLEVMNMHNDLRALHGVGPLTLSEEVITWNHSKTIVSCAQYLIWLKHTKKWCTLIQLSEAAQRMAEEMVERNKIAPTTTIQDLQGVNILGSWTSATSSMVGERPEPKDKIILFKFFPALCHGGGWVVVQWGGLPRLPLGESEL